MPEILISSQSTVLERLLSGTMIASFAALFLFGIRPRKVATPDPKAFAGVGAFNLVRSSAFRQTKGFEWLKMEVIDDVGLGMMMKQAGMRCGIANGLGLLSVEWYPSLGAIVRGFEKNFFAGFGWYSRTRTAWRLLQMTSVVVVPWCAAIMFALQTSSLALCAVLFFAHSILPFVGAVLVREKIPVPPFAFTALRLGFLLVAWAILRSAWKVSRRGGIEWRGTLYALQDLRAGQRVKL
jgi:hypothetical protein